MPTGKEEETPRQILFALCWRGEDGSLDSVKSLVESNQVGVNETDDNNVTALRFAAQYDHREIVTYLLDQGASTKIKAHDGIDPLLSAVEKRNIEVVKILLEAGASTRARSKDDMWPLKQARDNRHREMEQLLLDHGARDPRLTDKCVVL